eukprot:8332796-Ditylum_brightwellii.AAC.1
MLATIKTWEKVVVVTKIATVKVWVLKMTLVAQKMITVIHLMTTQVIMERIKAKKKKLSKKKRGGKFKESIGSEVLC